MKVILFILGFLAVMIFNWSSVEALTVINFTSSVPTLTASCETIEQCQSLENQAQQFYQQGKFDQSLFLLKTILQQYQQENERFGQIRVWRNIALVYIQQQAFDQAKVSLSSAFKLLETAQNTSEYQLLYAALLDIQAQIQLLTSQPELALETWKEAADIYREFNKITEWTRIQINQVQALQALGLYSKALNILVEAEQQLTFANDSLLKAKSLQSFGDVLRVLGNLNLSHTVLNQSLAIAKNIKNPDQMAMTKISLARTYTVQNQLKLAEKLYQEVIKSEISLDLKVQAQINYFSLIIQQKKVKEAVKIIPQIEKLIEQLPSSKTKASAQINLAQNLIQLHQQDHSLIPLLKISQQLKIAIQTAQLLQDKRSESYGLGLLGKLYQQNQQLKAAEDLTKAALQITQGINAYDIAYQWQWQIGQIFKAQNKRQMAIKAYIQAWKNLQSLRSDIVAINTEVQFDFRQQVEPIYRELVDLLISSNPTQDELKLAREVIESLQLAELDNFFKNACLNTQPVDINTIDPTAAIFYTISLEDRLELIVTVPNKPLLHHRVNLSHLEQETLIEQLNQAIFIPRERIFIENFTEPSQQLYLQLIQPFKQTLNKNHIQNLVFILDSGLRTIPLAALYDGQQYLIEQYNIALAPSLQLIDPQPIAQKQLNILGGGLTVARQGFSALPNVKLELQQIKDQTHSEILLNEDFTEFKVNQEVSQLPFSVVHLATHGSFSSQLEDTFILTWNEKINIEELRNLLKTDAKQLNPIELLVLSACQTATGDERSGLGLAGVAVRSGARSTIASLWSVDDESTALLMSYFYQELSQSQRTKAEALRRAQLAVLQQKDFAHPFFWAAFVLVGNWL